MANNDVTICMMLQEQLEKLCDDYCKYRDKYFSENKDPNIAQDKLCNEKCVDCPIGKIV